MKIALIDGSPKVNGSSSGILLKDIGEKLTEGKRREAGHPESEAQKTGSPGAETVEVGAHTPSIQESALKELKDADAFLFACPLYVDGLPSHLLSCLMQLEKASFSDGKKYVYGIVNCGFYEGVQAKTALEILANWCERTGLAWGGGVGVGGGGALSMLPDVPSGHGPKAAIDKALLTLAEAILTEKTQENIYVSVNMPRIFYKMAAQMGWRHMMKKNGGRTKDLSKRWE